MILSSPRVASPPRTAAEQAPDRRPRPWAPRAARLAAALAGLVAIGLYLLVALRRLDYPFDLEQLEANSLVEVHRILAGQALYPAPSAGYVATSVACAQAAGAAASMPRATKKTDPTR